MPRRRRGSNRQARRTIVVLGACVALCAMAIVVVSFWNAEGDPILPPEDPAIAAKRSSPGNQHNRLYEIAAGIPQKPTDFFTRDKEDHGFRGDYIPAYGSLGMMMDVRLMDDAQAFIDYLDAIDAVVPEVRDALSSNYVMTPPVDEYAYQLWSEPAKAMPRLCAGIAAIGKMHSMNGGDWQAAHDYFLLSLKLSLELGNDGSYIDYYSMSATQLKILPHYFDAVLSIAPLEELDRIIYEVEELTLCNVSVKAHLEYYWRGLDSEQSVSYLYGVNANEVRMGGFFDRMFVSRHVNSTRTAIREHMAELLDMRDADIETVNSWWELHAEELHNKQTGFAIVRTAAVNRVSFDAMFRGLRLAAELRRYRDAHGEYPETLEAFAEDAIDPWSPEGELFRYRRIGDDFTLYSIGPDGHDHEAKAGTRDARDIIIHRAASEIREEHEEILHKI